MSVSLTVLTGDFAPCVAQETRDARLHSITYLSVTSGELFALANQLRVAEAVEEKRRLRHLFNSNTTPNKDAQ